MTSSIIRVISRRTNSCATRLASSCGYVAASILAGCRADSGTLGEIVEREQAGPQAVVDVVGVVGDVVGDGGDLRFGAGKAPELQVLEPMLGHRAGSHAAARARDSGRSGCRREVGQRAVVLDQPFERLPGQIEAVECGDSAARAR